MNQFFTGTSALKRKGSTQFTIADHKFSDRKLTDWIVNHAQSFSVVENSDFKDFCNSLQEEYTVPTRNTIKNRILLRWAEEKNRVSDKIVRELEGSRCGITTDMWTSTAKRGYMVTTIHYINNSWEMQHVILAFIRVLYPHTGKRLASHLLDGVAKMNPKLLKSV